MARMHDFDDDDDDDDDAASTTSSQGSVDSASSSECSTDADDDASFVDLAGMKLSDPLTIQNSLQSPLLRLPPEIRLKIYAMVLNWKCLHVLYSEHDTFRTLPCKRPKQDDTLVEQIRSSIPPLDAVPPTLTRHICCLEHLECEICAAAQVHKSLTVLLTCRQVYLEAALLPFELQTFTIHTSAAFNRFIHKLTDAQAQKIKSLVLTDSDLLDFKRHIILKLRALDKLTIFVEVLNSEFGQASYKVGLYDTKTYVNFQWGAWTHLQAHQIKCIIAIEAREGSMYEGMVCFARRVANAIEKRIEDTIRIERNTLHKYFSDAR